MGQRPMQIAQLTNSALKGRQRNSHPQIIFDSNTHTMPQSLSQVYLHSVLSTKNRTPMIHSDIEKPLYAYIGGIIKKLGGIPIQINGMPEHIHVLSTLPRTLSIADYLEEIKKSSSKWIKTQDSLLNHFAWQRGYATFSVSSSVLPTVNQY